MIESNEAHEAADIEGAVDGGRARERCSSFENLMAGSPSDGVGMDSWATPSSMTPSASSHDSGSSLSDFSSLTSTLELFEPRGALVRISSFFNDDVVFNHVPSARARSSLVISAHLSSILRCVTFSCAKSFPSGKRTRKVPSTAPREVSDAFLAM